MRIPVAIAAVIVLAAKLIHPQFTAADIVGFVVTVPFLTVAIYSALGALGSK